MEPSQHIGVPEAQSHQILEESSQYKVRLLTVEVFTFLSSEERHEGSSGVGDMRRKGKAKTQH